MSNYDEDDKRPLPISKNKKVIGLFKNELGGRIMTEFVGLRSKTYAYLMSDDTEKKKEKGTKKCLIKRRLMFKNYIDYLLNNKIILQSYQRFKSNYHNVYTEQISQIALSSNDDKRLETFVKITTYPYGTNAFKVSESEMLSKIQMINFDDYANENKTEHILRWPYIPNHPYKILIIGGSGIWKNEYIIKFNKQPARS